MCVHPRVLLRQDSSSDLENETEHYNLSVSCLRLQKISSLFLFSLRIAYSICHQLHVLTLLIQDPWGFEYYSLSGLDFFSAGVLTLFFFLLYFFSMDSWSLVVLAVVLLGGFLMPGISWCVSFRQILHLIGNFLLLFFSADYWCH